MKQLFLSTLLVLLAACGQVSLSAAEADAGPPPPANWRQLVVEHTLAQLKDPESARFRFAAEPAKIFHAPQRRYMYSVTVFVNAKNSFGGYVGEHAWSYEIRDGRVVHSSDTTQTLRDIDRYLERRR